MMCCQEVCQELWCTDSVGECATNHMPPAEGTLCSVAHVASGVSHRTCTRKKVM